MNQQNTFEQLKAEFKLKDTDFYFLDLIPLIEMLWADGMNQEGELKILYKFVIEHIANLDQLSESAVISVTDANSFLDRFAHQKPDPRLINELMVLFHCKQTGNRQTILNYCLDIAAACTTQYPFALQERVMQEEKKLLENLFLEFGVSPHQEISIR